MSSLLLINSAHTLFALNNRLPFLYTKPQNDAVLVVRAASTSAQGKRTRRKKKQPNDDDSSSSSSASAAEKGLRFTFMEELMDRARNHDANGVTDVIYDMIAAGLNPGPRSFHGLIVAHVFNGDTEAAVPFFWFSTFWFLISKENKD